MEELQTLLTCVVVLLILVGYLTTKLIIIKMEKNDNHTSPEVKKLESIRKFRKVLVMDKVLRDLAATNGVRFEQIFRFSLKDGAIIVKTIIGGEDLGAVNIDYIYGDRDVADQLFDHYERIEENYTQSLLIKNLIG